MRGGAGVLVVLSKQPRAGFVKTRMCPPLSPAQAAELQECLLADVLAASASAAAGLDLLPVLAVHPPEGCAELARAAPAGFCVVAQRGRSLSERMDHAARQAAAWGARLILLRGSDSPLLDEALLRAALDALGEVDLALAPDLDGGYALVALRRPAPGLFEHPMSTDRVLRDTLANAEMLGLRARLLPAGFDLDTAEDLRRLARAGAPARRLCPRTLEWLEGSGLLPLLGG